MAEKILIADDDADICNLLSFSLEDAGYEVQICNNGRDVIETAREEKPDVLILDVMLPGIDGATIAKRMSEDSDLKDIPIVVITALEASKNLFQPIMQISKFITKPFNTEDLLEAVDNAIKGVEEEDEEIEE